MMTARWLFLPVVLATTVCSGTSRGTPTPGTPNERGPGNLECIPVGSDCTGIGLPRVTEREWSATDIAAFVARTARGTTAVDHRSDKTRLLADCQLDGRYDEIGGKPGAGRLWVTSRPLFRVDEISPACAEATHAVAAFARKGTRFEALLVPLPCPSVADPKPALGCVGRGFTGAERLQKSKTLQARLEPVKVVPRDKKEYKRMLYAGELDMPRKPDIPSDGWLLDMWALTPDDYQAVRWLPEANKDCPMAAQAVWLASFYSKDSEPGTPAKPSGQAPPAFRMRLDYGWETDCRGRPVFLTCFPALFLPAIDSICFPGLYVRR